MPIKEKSRYAVEWLKQFNRSSFDLVSEVMLYSKEIQLAGTIDLLVFDKEKKIFNIYDWKTSKSIDKESYESQMGRVPATIYLKDCNYIHYSLQLSLYKYILEEYWGLQIENITILHLTDFGVKPYECIYMKGVIEEMLKYDRKKLAIDTDASITKYWEPDLLEDQTNFFEPEQIDFIDLEELEGPNPEDFLE